MSEDADELAEIYYDLAWYFGEAKHGAPAKKAVAKEVEDWDLEAMLEKIELNNELSSEFETNFMENLDQLFNEENGKN